MIKKIILFILVTIKVYTASAQSDTIAKTAKQFKIDSLSKKFKKDSSHLYRFQKVRPYLAIDNRNSFIKDVPVNVKGIQFGVILHERHTVAIGFYGINASASKNVKTKIGDEDVLITTKLNYMTLFYQFALIDKRYYEIDIPFEFGLGGFDIKATSQKDGRVLRDTKGGIIPFGTGLTFVFKPFKQIGISSTFGYRFVAQKYANLNFNGAYYSIGIWVDLRQCYRDTRFYGFMRPKYKKRVKRIENFNIN